MYTALVLTEESRKQIVDLITQWPGIEILFHHMTINMGPAKDPCLLEKEFEVKILAYGHDHIVGAYMVETECPSCNKVKHITLWVDREGGGKPVMSNKITKWNTDWNSDNKANPILHGVVKECE